MDDPTTSRHARRFHGTDEHDDHGADEAAQTGEPAGLPEDHFMPALSLSAAQIGSSSIDLSPAPLLLLSDTSGRHQRQSPSTANLPVLSNDMYSGHSEPINLGSRSSTPEEGYHSCPSSPTYDGMAFGNWEPVESIAANGPLGPIASILQRGFAQLHVDLQSLDRRLTSLELAQNEQGPSGNARRNRNRSNRSKAQRKSPVGDAEPWQQRGALAGDARRVPLSTWPGPPLQPIDDTWGVNNAHDNNASHNYIHDFDEGDNDSTGPLAKALQPEAQSKIASLPAEIVRRILVYASEACMDASFTDLQQWSKGAWDSWKDDEHGHASSVVDRKGYPAVQRWLLSLQCICKQWQPTVLAYVMQNLHIATSGILRRLIEVLQSKPSIAALLTDRALVHRHAVHSKQRSSPDFGAPRRQASLLDDDDEETAETYTQGKTTSSGGDLTYFLDAAKSLQHLELCSGLESRQNQDHRFAVLPLFYKRRLLDALICLNLRTLILDSLVGAADILRARLFHTEAHIYFVDLQSILLGMPTLEVLEMLGGLSSGDRRDDVAADDHAARLKTFCLQNGSHAARDLGLHQLCWLLRPSIGFLKNLDLGLDTGQWANPGHMEEEFADFGMNGGMNDPFIVGPNGGLGGGLLGALGAPLGPAAFGDALGEGNAAPSHPLITISFATVLVQLGGTLQALRLTSTPEMTPHGPWAQQHHGIANLDSALCHCIRLRQIEIVCRLTGPQFLESISAMSNLKRLVMVGEPRHSGAGDFVQFLKLGRLPSLREIKLHGFLRRPGSEGWSSRNLRDFRDLCEEMDIELAIDTIRQY